VVSEKVLLVQHSDLIVNLGYMLKFICIYSFSRNLSKDRFVIGSTFRVSIRLVTFICQQIHVKQFNIGCFVFLNFFVFLTIFIASLVSL